MVQKKFYNIQELAIILGKSTASIHGHLARKQFDAVPPPMRLGRRLAWLVEFVDAWIEAKADTAVAQTEASLAVIQAPCKRRGRPTKAEAKARDRFAFLSAMHTEKDHAHSRKHEISDHEGDRHE